MVFIDQVYLLFNDFFKITNVKVNILLITIIVRKDYRFPVPGSDPQGFQESVWLFFKI